MKKHLLVLASAVTLLTYTNAQSQNIPAPTNTEHNHNHDGHDHPHGDGEKALTPEEKAQKVADRLEQKLTLSADQKTKIYALTLDKIKKTREIRAMKGKDPKVRKEEFKKLRADYDTKVKGTLSPEQQAKWEQLKAEAKAKREAARQANGGKEKAKETKKGKQKQKPAEESGDLDLEKDIDDAIYEQE
jgi:hypothetical protein